MKGAEAPFMEIRSGGMYGARSGCKPLPLSLEVCPKGARTSDVKPLQEREAILQRIHFMCSIMESK